jgi:hypothetical protein
MSRDDEYHLYALDDDGEKLVANDQTLLTVLSELNI